MVVLLPDAEGRHARWALAWLGLTSVGDGRSCGRSARPGGRARTQAPRRAGFRDGCLATAGLRAAGRTGPRLHTETQPSGTAAMPRLGRSCCACSRSCWGRRRLEPSTDPVSDRCPGRQPRRDVGDGRSPSVVSCHDRGRIPGGVVTQPLVVKIKRATGSSTTPGSRGHGRPPHWVSSASAAVGSDGY
jgi:hypothetical protein